MHHNTGPNGHLPARHRVRRGRTASMPPWPGLWSSPIAHALPQVADHVGGAASPGCRFGPL